MAEKKKVRGGPTGHSGDHETHAACCKSLEALACAAACIKEHQACCGDDDTEGAECCDESLSLVLDAIDLHTAHLRKCCELEKG